MFHFFVVNYAPTTINYSHIMDLEMVMIEGDLQVLASTNYDGSLTHWALTSSGLIIDGTSAYEGGLCAGGYRSLIQVEVKGMTCVLTGGAALGEVQLLKSAVANLETGSVVLGVSASAVAGMVQGQTVDLANGNQSVYSAMLGMDGFGRLILDQSGNVVSTGVLRDTDTSFEASVTDTASASVGFAP